MITVGDNPKSIVYNIMKIRFLFLLIAVLGVSLCVNAQKTNNKLPDNVGGMLVMLDNALSNSEKYYSAKQARIDSLKGQLHNDNGRLALYEAIGNEYRYFNIDSALTYFDAGRRMAISQGDKAARQRFMIYWAEALPVKGVSAEALELFQSITPDSVFSQNKILYYEVGSRFYFSLSSDYSIRRYREKYLKKAVEFSDSAVSLMNPDSNKCKSIKAALAYGRGDRPAAVEMINDLLESCAMDDHLFAMASSMLGTHYQSIPGKENETLYYKGLAAISDILSGVKEETALNAVAMILYSRGDIERAYRCVTHSLGNAVESGSGLRAMQTAGSLPLISSSYRMRDQQKLEVLTWMVVALVVALLAIIYAIIVVRREMKKLQLLRQRSNEAHLLKDTFISQFLNLCSLYMEKSEEFNRMAIRKIKANQIEDLYNHIKSGKGLEEQKDMFCEIFDNSFVRIYPTFVDEVNRLLLPYKQIELSAPNRLTTELRILAFMRLGLDDSVQIARFLRLTLNTIYTYRNKLKSKAKNRDTFERDVMKISQIT